MNTDLLTEDLKKARSSNQSFWLMGQPDIDVRTRKDGLYEVEVNGFDYFDTVKGELVSGGKAKIAVWSLDTDYDERSLFPRQVFFPMAGAKDGWHKLRKDIRAELDEDATRRVPRHGVAAVRGGRPPQGRGEGRGRPRHRVAQGHSAGLIRLPHGQPKVADHQLAVRAPGLPLARATAARSVLEHGPPLGGLRDLRHPQQHPPHRAARAGEPDPRAGGRLA